MVQPAPKFIGVIINNILVLMQLLLSLFGDFDYLAIGKNGASDDRSEQRDDEISTFHSPIQLNTQSSSRRSIIHSLDCI